MRLEVLVMSVVLATVPIFGEEPERCTNPCSDGPSMAALRTCLVEELDRADEEVETYFNAALEEWKFVPSTDPDPESREAMDRMSREIPENLREAQQLWLKYVDADCAAVGAIWTTGSGRAPAVLGCRLERAKRRSLDLWSHYLDGGKLPRPVPLCE